MKFKKETHLHEEMKEELNQWFSTEELLEYLGISAIELKHYSSQFVEGVHYRHEILNELNSPTLWRIDLVDELLCLPIAPLEKEAMIKAINNHITCHQ